MGQRSRVRAGAVGRSAGGPVLMFVALATLALAGACGVVDGGLEPVTKLPPPPTRPDTGTPDGGDTIDAGDTTGDTDPSTPTLAVVVAGGTTVDGDWMAVSFEVTHFALGSDGAIALVVTSADGATQTQTVSATSAVVRRVPSGAATLRAELLDSTGKALVPPVVSELALTVTRAAPSLQFVAPSEGAVLPGDGAAVDVRFTTADFTLLAANTEPTGPRQGRIRLVLDDSEVGDWSVLEGTVRAGAGPHVLKATLVDEVGTAWPDAIAASVAFTVEAPPTITIEAPTGTRVLEGTRFTAKIATERFVLDGQSLPGHGTWRATLDGSAHAKLVGDLATFEGLPAGKHHLEVALRGADDSPLAIEAIASVDFESIVPAPTLDFVLPAIASVKEGAVGIAVIPHHFTFSAVGFTGLVRPATGGWRLRVDDVLVSDKLTATETTVVLTAGQHFLEAELIDMTGAPLSPPVIATRLLNCLPRATGVAILAPLDGATVPRRFPVAVALSDFTLSTDVLSPDSPPVPGRGHFHAFLRKDGTESFVYQGFFVGETFQLEVPEPGGYDLRIALHYENHSQVMPAVEAAVHVTVDATPGIRILQPRTGDALRAEPFAVTVAVDNFELIPPGEVSDLRGHYHLFIDGDYQGFFADLATILDPRAAVPAALAAGAHAIRAFLHRSDHTPVDGARGHTVNVTYLPVPDVAILAPADGARVTTAPFAVEARAYGLILSNAAGGANVAGEGHFHVFVDSVYQGIQTTPNFTVQIPEAGRHVLTVSLHQNDHSPVPDAQPAVVSVEVDAAPRVVIRAPEDGGFVYGVEVDAWLEGENLASGSETELWVDDVLVYQGLPGLVALPALADGVHTLSTLAIDATGEPLIGSVQTTVSFEVLDLTGPTVAFVRPTSGSVVSAGTAIVIGVTDFMLDAHAGWSPAVPGDGLWTLAVGDVRYGPFAGSAATVPALPPGVTTLVAELWHRDGSPVWPPARAELTVSVDAAQGIALVSPAEGAMWYGSDVRVAVATTGISLAKGSGGWLVVRVDGALAAYFSDAEGVIGPFAPGQHVIDVEAVDAAGKAYVPPLTARGSFRYGGVAEPALTVTSPPDESTVGAGSFEVGFAWQGVRLEPGLLGGVSQPGFGAVLVLVDGRVKAIATASPALVRGVSPGLHEVELVLAGVDLVPVWPRVADRVRVKVLAGVP